MSQKYKAMIDELLDQINLKNQEGLPSTSKVTVENNIGKISVVLNKDQSADYLLAQYDKIFMARLKDLRECFKAYLGKKKERLTTVVEIDDRDKTNIYVFGIVNKKMKAMESYVKEVQKPEFFEINYQRKSELFNPTDVVLLEDETGKVELTESSKFKLDDANLKSLGVQSLTTGCPICVYGHINEDSKFEVEKFIFLPVGSNFKTDSHHKTKLSSSILEENGNKGKVMLISSLKAKRENLLQSKYLQLKSFLNDQTNSLAASVNLLAVFGGIWSALDNVNASLFYNYNFNKNFENIREDFMLVSAYVDRLFEGYLKHPTFESQRTLVVAPSLTDPANTFMPQAPMSQVLFKNAGKNRFMTFISNPGHAKLNNELNALFLDGLNVKDLVGQSNINFYEAAKYILVSRVLIPTAPNTIECFPSIINDPFVIHEIPSLIIIGNSPEFKQDQLVDEDGNLVSHLIFVSDFSLTGECVFLDLSTMATETIIFS